MKKWLLFPYRLIGGIIFLILSNLITFFYSFFCLCCFKLPAKTRYNIINFWTWLTIFLLRLLCGVRYEIEGLENIPKENGIIFSKHQSTWETFVLPRVFSQPAIILKKELLNVPFFGWGLRLLDPIAINRKNSQNALMQVLKEGKERLDRGQWLLIFPEGSRSNPGEKTKYQIGGAIIAEQTGYPITPIAHNAGKYWPKRRFLKNPGTIKVVIGPPIQTQGKNARKILREAKEWIETKMLELQ